MESLHAFEIRKLAKLEGTMLELEVSEATMKQLSDCLAFLEELCSLLPKKLAVGFCKLKDDYATLKTTAEEAKSERLAKTASAAFLGQDPVSTRA